MSVEIHSTAIVEDGAELGTNVKVGPFTIIGANVKIGDNSLIKSHVVIDGHTTIGMNNEIHQFSSIGVPPQDKSYKNEVYHNFPHYVSLQNVNVKNEDILANITPLKDINISDNQGLLAEEEDPFNNITVLDLDCSNYSVMDYEGSDYEAMHDAMLKKITDDPEILKIASLAPKHLGVAFVNSNEAKKAPEVTAFNINKQKSAFQAEGINLDPTYYETTAYELLVLLFLDNKIYPVIIYKNSLLNLLNKSDTASTCDQVEIDLSEFGGEKVSINVPKNQYQDFSVNPLNDKLGRNEPCLCGSGKKYKKCCLH